MRRRSAGKFPAGGRIGWGTGGPVRRRVGGLAYGAALYAPTPLWAVLGKPSAGPAGVPCRAAQSPSPQSTAWKWPAALLGLRKFIEGIRAAAHPCAGRRKPRTYFTTSFPTPRCLGWRRNGPGALMGWPCPPPVWYGCSDMTVWNVIWFSHMMHHSVDHSMTQLQPNRRPAERRLQRWRRQLRWERRRFFPAAASAAVAAGAGEPASKMAVQAIFQAMRTVRISFYCEAKTAPRRCVHNAAGPSAQINAGHAGTDAAQKLVGDGARRLGRFLGGDALGPSAPMSVATSPHRRACVRCIHQKLVHNTRPTTGARLPCSSTWPRPSPAARGQPSA